MKPALEKLFQEYSDAHQHPTNQLAHKIAMPLIVFHVLAMLDWIPLFAVAGTGFAVTLAHPVYLGVFAWYLRQDFKLALILGAAFLPALPIGWLLPKLAVVAIAVAAWSLQLAGHAVWEKKRPSFFSNLVHALIGPLFFAAIVTGEWPAKPARMPTSAA